MGDRAETSRRWKAALRDASWLDARRVRAYAIMLLIVYAAMLVPPFLDATPGAGERFPGVLGGG